jgi:dephospho-CoA kinase
MKMVGLTGGIGAGKSAVATRFAAHGAVVVDSDKLAREVVEPGTEGLARVVERFGPEVLRPDGSLDRPALGRLVFGDDDARKALEAIIHPLVRARSAQLTSAAASDAVVVNDVPLLVESGMAPMFEEVVVVFADETSRVERLVRDRGMSPEEARSRIAAQATDEQRRAVATISIVNDGTREELLARADEVWSNLVRPLTT